MKWRWWWRRWQENVSAVYQTGDDRSPTVSPRVRRVPANRFPQHNPNIFLSKYLCLQIDRSPVIHIPKHPCPKVSMYQCLHVSFPCPPIVQMRLSLKIHKSQQLFFHTYRLVRYDWIQTLPNAASMYLLGNAGQGRAEMFIQVGVNAWPSPVIFVH